MLNYHLQGSTRRLMIMAIATLLVLANKAGASLPDYMAENYDIDISGFIEARQGWRLQEDPLQEDESISEMRFQLTADKAFENLVLQFKGDLVGDRVDEEVRGEVREFNATFSPLEVLDVKIGRQTLTWGTGDLLFINDLFPKDWESFFIGRDDAYLKAPSDVVKLSFFFDLLDMDLVYAPRHNPSAYIDGKRISYWNPMLDRLAGRDAPLEDLDREDWFDDGTFSVRLSKNLSGVEASVYGYNGFWNTPEGFDIVKMKAIYPRLEVYGASLRSPLWGGIINAEAGYYNSLDDRNGNDPLIRNSEMRLLIGYERELARELTGGVQYYLERMSDYTAYERGTTPGQPQRDELRQVLTLRLNKLLMNQNLKLSFFGYYSPTDEDAFLRPKVLYKLTDQWALEAGANLFLGKYNHTFFGQFQDTTNAYAGVRWNY
jgi:hypothetical protein